MEIRLDGKTMLITGASTGFGRATAIEAAASGVSLVGINYCHSEDEARETLAAVEAKGGKGVLLKADVRNVDDVDRMFGEFLAASDGRLDILVNNAGGLVGRTTIEDLTDEVWDEVIALNVTGLVNCSRRAIPVLKKGGGGVIVNMSSIAAKIGGAGGAAHYAAAKGAVNSLSIGLAKELAPFNIRVVGLMPGVIPTRFHEKFTTPERMKELREMIPLKRYGTPEQIAAAVIFLASESADFITGTFLNISGGW